MNVVTVERTRTCVRCREEFTEPAGTVTCVCDDCPGRRPTASLEAAGGSVVERGRERTCIRCSQRFLEVPGEVSRLCRSCDPDHVVLE